MITTIISDDITTIQTTDGQLKKDLFKLYSNCIPTAFLIKWFESKLHTTYIWELSLGNLLIFDYSVTILSIIVCFFRPITSSNLTNSVIVIFESILIFVICRKADPSLVEFPTEEDLQLTPSPCISPQVKLFQSSLSFFQCHHNNHGLHHIHHSTPSSSINHKEHL